MSVVRKIPTTMRTPSKVDSARPATTTPAATSARGATPRATTVAAVAPTALHVATSSHAAVLGRNADCLSDQEVQMAIESGEIQSWAKIKKLAKIASDYREIGNIRVCRVDGVLGLKSRVAIREVQIKFGLPADGWPSAELMTRLRGGRT